MRSAAAPSCEASPRVGPSRATAARRFSASAELVGSALGAALGLLVEEQEPDEVAADPDGAHVEHPGPAELVANDAGDEGPSEAADVDHHVEDAEAHGLGLVRRDVADRAHDHRLERRGPERDQQEHEEEAPEPVGSPRKK